MSRKKLNQHEFLFSEAILGFDASVEGRICEVIKRMAHFFGMFPVQNHQGAVSIRIPLLRRHNF